MSPLPTSNSRKHLALLLLPVVSGVLAILVFLVSLSNSVLSTADLLVVSDAEILPLDIELADLSEHESEWISIEFPYHWRNQFPSTRAVWYRLGVSAAELNSLRDPGLSYTNPQFGIYVWRLNQTADFWVNGTKIGSGGNTTEPMARHWNSPLYFPVPSSLIADQNEILIKHFAQHSWGSMEPLVVGDESNLKPVYERRYFVQHDVSLGLFVFVAVAGLFCFTTWFYRRQETRYLWFAIASAGLSFYCLNQFVRYLPVGADTWRWLSNMTTDLWAGATLIFLLRSLNLDRPRAEKTVFLYLFSGLPIYYYASFNQVFDINIYYHAGSLLIGVYALYICVHCYLQTRQMLPLLSCCAIVVIFTAGIHDTAMQAIVNNGWRGTPTIGFQNHYNFLPYTAPIIFLFAGASLIGRFIKSMNAADNLNAELEQRIDHARQELTENYRAMEQVLVRQSASEERERIYRDLHDDVGSKLLSLYYRLDNESDSVLAKSALEDLRDIVSRKTLDGCLLSIAESQWHQEALSRMADAEISLDWQFDSFNDDAMLDELQHAHLRRMLREVFSNAILHSKDLTAIRVVIRLRENRLSISVANDGAPKPISDWKDGRGISNLRVRTRDLNGEMEIVDLEGSWVEVNWTIPIETDARGDQ